MTTNEIVAALDEEIRLLERAKALLAEAKPVARRRGRPKGSTNKQTSFNPAEFAAKPRRKLSASARERIAAAQRARWAKLKGKAEPRKIKKKDAAPSKAGKRKAPPQKSTFRRPASAAKKAAAPSQSTEPSA